jgi:hypothetical protein
MDCLDIKHGPAWYGWLLKLTLTSEKYQASIVEMKNLEKKHFRNEDKRALNVNICSHFVDFTDCSLLHPTLLEGLNTKIVTQSFCNCRCRPEGTLT